MKLTDKDKEMLIDALKLSWHIQEMEDFLRKVRA
jgi:hypothetical protein